MSVIESFDPETLRFRLREPHPMKAGDRFEVIAPSVNWNIHDNIDHRLPATGRAGFLRQRDDVGQNNIVTRGEAADVKAAIEVRGRFHLIGNHVVGFDEKAGQAATKK